MSYRTSHMGGWMEGRPTHPPTHLPTHHAAHSNRLVLLYLPSPSNVNRLNHPPTSIHRNVQAARLLVYQDKRKRRLLVVAQPVDVASFELLSFFGCVGWVGG